MRPNYPAYSLVGLKQQPYEYFLRTPGSRTTIRGDLPCLLVVAGGVDRAPLKGAAHLYHFEVADVAPIQANDERRWLAR